MFACLLALLEFIRNDLLPRQRGLGLNFGFLFVFFFFPSVSHKSPFGLYSACVKSYETAPPVVRMVSNFQKFSSLKVYGKDSMICRRSMKLERNEDIRCSRFTRKDLERNGSVCKPYEINLRANIYE